MDIRKKMDNNNKNIKFINLILIQSFNVSKQLLLLLLLSCAKSHMLSASRRQPHLLHASAVRPPSNLVNGQKLTMCDIVWISPQSHSSLSVKPHFLWHALQWPWPVWKRYSSDHWRLWRSKPGSRIVGSTTKVELTETNALPVHYMPLDQVLNTNVPSPCCRGWTWLSWG